jgi:GT2 family glycosyltransferase
MGRLEPASRYAEPCEVLAPSACAALYRKEVLDAIGGFDPDFFAYCEDLDLGMRARLAGWTGWYVPTAVVYHKYSGTGGKYSPFKAFLVERNHLFVLLKLFPKRLILASPFYTAWRYALQAYGVFAGKGASGRFAEEGSALRLLPVLLKAYGEAFAALPKLLAKRRAIQRGVRVDRREVLSWFDRFGISAFELTLKD